MAPDLRSPIAPFSPLPLPLLFAASSAGSPLSLLPLPSALVAPALNPHWRGAGSPRVRSGSGSYSHGGGGGCGLRPRRWLTGCGGAWLRRWLRLRPHPTTYYPTPYRSPTHSLPHTPRPHSLPHSLPHCLPANAVRFPMPFVPCRVVTCRLRGALVLVSSCSTGPVVQAKLLRAQAKLLRAAQETRSGLAPRCAVPVLPSPLLSLSPLPARELPLCH
jgi:hypothetical protein